MSRVLEPIRSRHNPLFRRLLDARRRGSPDLALIFLEGAKLLEEALDAGVAVVEVALSPRVLEASRAARAVARAESAGAAVRLMEEALVASLSEMENSPGLLALARRPSFDEARIFSSATPLVAVAVQIQNPGNLGGLLRTAEAAGATGAYLTEGTADPFSWKALRGSMGSAFRLPHAGALPPGEALALLRRRGVALVAAVIEGGVPYDEADLAGPVALLFGNEGAGLPPEVAGAAGQRVCIPLHGPAESLNVGVAAGVLLFEAARQRRSKSRSPDAILGLRRGVGSRLQARGSKERKS